MNKKIILMLLMIFMIIGIGISSANTLRLVAKDSNYSEVPNNGNSTLTYNPIGFTFDYSLVGTVPLENMDYALIYYKDKADQYGNWGHVGAIIGNATSDSNRNITMSGSADIDSIPHIDDANNATGAKIWLIPTENIDVNNMTMVPEWHPNNYLFEENLRYPNNTEIIGTSHLITYTETFPVLLNKNIYGSGYITTNQWNINIPVNSSYNITIPVNETATFGFSVNNNNGTTTGFIIYQQIGLNTRTNVFGNVNSSNIDIVNKTATFSGIATINGIGNYSYTASINDDVNFGINIPLLIYTVEPDTNINYGVVIYKQN